MNTTPRIFPTGSAAGGDYTSTVRYRSYRAGEPQPRYVGEHVTCEDGSARVVVYIGNGGYSTDLVDPTTTAPDTVTLVLSHGQVAYLAMLCDIDDDSENAAAAGVDLLDWHSARNAVARAAKSVSV